MKANFGLFSSLKQASEKTSSPSVPSAATAPGASAQEGTGKLQSGRTSPTSPALSTASTADGEEEDIELSPTLPPLPAPKLPGRVAELLRTPPSVLGEEKQFGTASWGSPYPRTDRNLRRQSFSSEPSDDSPIHNLSIETPFLRQTVDNQPQEQAQPPISAAAAVLANRARRQHRGLTEDWIRTHTTGAVNAEPRHWFSEGSDSDSEHSSLSGSDLPGINDKDSRTPRAGLKTYNPRTSSLHSRGRSSLETLKPELSSELRQMGSLSNMADAAEARQSSIEVNDHAKDYQLVDEAPSETPAVSTAQKKSKKRTASTNDENMNVHAEMPATPVKVKEKSVSHELNTTPRIKKKVPWKGKNILVLIPRDERRGLPGGTPAPLRPGEVQKMFQSWQELGYSVDGFDLLAEGCRPPNTHNSQSRIDWPTAQDMARERAERSYNVVLPDLNAWKNYVDELQEAKLRALGVSSGEEEPPNTSISPSISNPSRQASTQHASHPFSPPILTSSASSGHGFASFPFPAQFFSGLSSPGLSSGPSPAPFTSGKPNPRQSISLPAGSSPFAPPQSQAWSNASFLQGSSRTQSPLANLNGISPRPPYGFDSFEEGGNHGLGLHQRRQSLQFFPSQQTTSMVSPHLQDVCEDDEENLGQFPSKTLEQARRVGDRSQAEIDKAEYHLEEQLRNQLEHEDYNPRSAEPSMSFVPMQSRDATSHGLAITERFANEPGKLVELHHPRPHSRGHSVSQTFFGVHSDTKAFLDEPDYGGRLGPLREIPETNQDEGERQEIETNPSNLGTPVQKLDFATAFGHPRDNMSTHSNPWQTQDSGASSARHSSHTSKSSLTKLNVGAPEFKFRPSSGLTSHPHDFMAGSVTQSINSSAVPQFGSFKMHASAPSFAPGQGSFSFQSVGPTFRPDAPAFTPFGTQNDAAESVRPEIVPRQNSIFGEIKIPTASEGRAMKKSKAIPIVRPSSQSSLDIRDDTKGPEAFEDGPDGRLADPSRVKRARGALDDDDAIPGFAERSDVADDSGLISEAASTNVCATENKNDDDHSAPKAVSENEDPSLQVDTSLSSTAISGQLDTLITTAAPSEASSPKATAEDVTLGTTAEEENASAAAEDSLLTTVSSNLAQQSPVTSVNEKSESTEKVIASAVESHSSDVASHVKSSSAQGLAASIFARPQSLVADERTTVMQSIETEPASTSELAFDSHDQSADATATDREPTFEEIDAVMQQMESDPSMGVNKMLESSPGRPESADPVDAATSGDSKTNAIGASRDGASLTPRPNRTVSAATLLRTTELEDPFIDPPTRRQSLDYPNDLKDAESISEPDSEWDAAFSEDEQEKLESRTQFFDGRVNEIVGNLLASRLEPLEKVLTLIQTSLVSKNRRNHSLRREARSTSADVQDSDADDEDEEPALQRSVSPRRDRKMEQMRLAVTEALASHQRSQTDIPFLNGSLAHPINDVAPILTALEDIREQMAANMQVASQMETSDRGSSGRDIPEAEQHAQQKLVEFQSMMTDLGERLSNEQKKLEKEIQDRRAAEDAAAELNRKLQVAETRVEVEIINRSVFDQRVVDLEERIRHHEGRTEEEIEARRAAEDRLSEVQRLLRISSEEESRLRDSIEDKDARIKSLEQQSSESSMRLALMEATQDNSTQFRGDLTNRHNIIEADLKAVRQDNNHLRSEAQQADNNARRAAGELAETVEENKHLRKSLQTLTSQVEENERLRESWRSKFMSLQDDMGRAAREIAEETSQRIKKEQAMLARQEVLDARLQAEAKTRERLEVEMERLQENERAGMRAVNECKRLESLLLEMRTENHRLQQMSLRHQREFQEARESGASEVNRTRMAMQNEVETANNHVNVIREELEEQNSKLRAELDNVKLEVDTAKAQSEMLLEEAQSTRVAEVEAARQRHQNEVEDMQARFERQMTDRSEEASRAEEQLLQRLSLSSSKIEHLQDRIVHLEDKLEIAREAANAAAQAAKSAGVETGGAAPVIGAQARQNLKSLEAVPEKVSPQALRESIMVLQEQLQAREQRIEELEQSLSKLDPDAASKISKRDDEITWLRELLAVRHGDLQDIISALSGDQYNREAVRDAAIRLKANLQMEEQERDRAMHGGSTIINLPNIAQGIQAASPRVAQTIGPIAAAWDNWRRSSQPSFHTISSVLSSPAPVHGPVKRRNNATPSKGKGGQSTQNNLLNGLMTPPASDPRHSSAADASRPQPTAFANTGRRIGSSNLGRNRGESNSTQQSDQAASDPDTPARRKERSDQLRTPPVIDAGYDSDAQPGDFDDHEFFEDD